MAPQQQQQLKPLPDLLASTLSTLHARLPAHLAAPTVGIVCGSGLSTLAGALKECVLVGYEELDGFGRSTGGFPFYLFGGEMWEC